jgi:dehydrogenase/reductase SDR family member 12
MSLWDTLLDRSIYFSFDASGFRRHARAFDAHDLEVDLAGRTCLVTGASSGLGVEIARGLYERGANVLLLCRDVAKGETVMRGLTEAGGRAPSAKTGSLAVHAVDLSDMASVRGFAERYTGPVDVLVHNAGILPLEATVTKDGLELAVATNLVGPFLLTHLLWARLRASADPRLIHVSSGGMYSEKLDVALLFAPAPVPPAPYDGVVAYARTKRAQVVLSEQLAARAPHVHTSAMHPGWADTPGVSTSLPRFHRFTRGRLRTPAEGADTVIWLAASAAGRDAGGRFFFDRAPQSPHLLARTHETEEERAPLWSEMCRLVGADEERDFR